MLQLPLVLRIDCVRSAEVVFPSPCLANLRLVDSYSAAWTTFGTFFIKNSWAWRIPSAVQALPSVLQIFLIWFVPESPRWLISKGREEEGRRILAHYHARGDT